MGAIKKIVIKKRAKKYTKGTRKENLTKNFKKVKSSTMVNQEVRFP